MVHLLIFFEYLHFRLLSHSFGYASNNAVVMRKN